MRTGNDAKNGGSNNQRVHSLRTLYVIVYPALSAVLLTVVVLWFCLWFIHKDKKTTLEIGKVEARASFNKDLLYRRWVAGHGGVYVPVTKDSPPNPYLAHVKERDITTPSGVKLTLINPAYMTRQVFELAKEQYGVRGHITSLNPIRRDNAPDAWETDALKKFEKGLKEVCSVETIGGKPYVRLMSRMVTEDRCLKCHAAQGYKLGDVRGGISVSVPMEQYLALERDRLKPVLLECIIAWFIGIFSLASISSVMKRRFEQLDRETRAKELSEEKFRSLFENAGDAIFLMREGKIVDCNENTLEMFQRGKDQLIGASPVAFSPVKQPDGSDSEESASEKMRAAERSKQVFEWKQLRADGSDFDAEVNLSPLTLNGEKCLMAIVRDISNRKRAEKDLRESELKLRTIFESSRDAIGVSIKGVHKLANPAYLELFGYTSFAELENILVPDLIAPGSREQIKEYILKRAAGEAVPSSYITRGLKKDGAEFDMEVNVSTYELDGAMHTLVLLRDITDRIQMQKEKEQNQAQLYQSQKMDAVGQLAGGMAHDFNNMLGVILSAAELARTDIGEDSPAQEELRTINEAVRRSRELTMKLLTFARRDKIAVAGVEAEKILKSLHGMLVRTIPKNVEIQISAKDKSVVKCDQNQIHQALLNICNNAVDAMPNGGTLCVESEEAVLPDRVCDGCGESLGGRYCLIQITDTGIGMQKEILERITEPFFTTKGAGKGTGLGLSVTQGILRSHGGHIHIYSEPGRGTNVKIYLPIDEEIAAKADEVSEKKPIRGVETILVVDDENRLLQLTGKSLSKNGYKPLLAESGGAALELYGKHMDEIAVVVLDLMMPGMDGAEVDRRLKELNPKVKIVLSSGFSEDGVAANLLKGEYRRFVQKPFDTATLCLAIRELIDVGE